MGSVPNNLMAIDNSQSVGDNSGTKRGRDQRSPQQITALDVPQEGNTDLLSPQRKAAHSENISRTVTVDSDITLAETSFITLLTNTSNVDIKLVLKHAFSSLLIKNDVHRNMVTFTTQEAAAIVLRDWAIQTIPGIQGEVNYFPDPTPLPANLGELFIELPMHNFQMLMSCIVKTCEHCRSNGENTFYSIKEVAHHWNKYHPDIIRILGEGLQTTM